MSADNSIDAADKVGPAEKVNLVEEISRAEQVNAVSVASFGAASVLSIC